MGIKTTSFNMNNYFFREKYKLLIIDDFFKNQDSNS